MKAKVRIVLTDVYEGWIDVEDGVNPEDTEEIQYQALREFSRNNRTDFEQVGDRMEVEVEEVDVEEG